MNKNNREITVITPQEGYLLTQSGDIELRQRVFSNKIYLAVTDSVDNWEEIPIEDAENLKTQQLALIELEESGKEND